MSFLMKQILFMYIGLLVGWAVIVTILNYLKVFNDSYFTHGGTFSSPAIDYLIFSITSFSLFISLVFLLKNFPVSKIFSFEIGFLYVLLLILGDYYFTRPISTSYWMDEFCSQTPFLNTYFADLIFPYLIYPFVVFLSILLSDYLILNKLSFLKFR